MVTLTFFNLGDADTCRINLRDGRRILVDYANKRDATDEDDKRCDLPQLLSDDLKDAGLKGYAVVAFTHLDDDHVKGSSEFFEFDHAAKYTGGARKKIETLWVPASAITEENLKDDSRIIRQEARYRLLNGYGIKVFSRPERIKKFLEDNDLSIDDRESLFVNAGKLVDDFSLWADGAEFFAHSPHARRTNEQALEDRNGDSLVFQARFSEGGMNTDVLFAADVDHEVLAEIVDITKSHNNHSRLHWNVYKLPHHCSYTAIGPEKGDDKTEPTEQIKWLCETQGEKRGYIISPSKISPSKPIPMKGSDEDKDNQPPHREAANYYREDVVEYKRLLVTMSEPNENAPKPIVIEIGRDGAVQKTLGALGTAAIVSGAAPRAGGQ
jgi:hypothetical protein